MYFSGILGSCSARIQRLRVAAQLKSLEKRKVNRHRDISCGVLFGPYLGLSKAMEIVAMLLLDASRWESIPSSGTGE